MVIQAHSPLAREVVSRPVFERWDKVFASAAAWQPPTVPTVVVVPHPDDEVLIAGGLIRLQRDRRVPVRIVAVTDGEAAYDDDDRDDIRRQTLGGRRRREQRDSLELLGVGRGDVDRLDLPDGAVTDHVSELADWIASEYSDHLVVAPWSHDVHPDHEACGRAATVASARTGNPLWYGFFWTWHRSDPDLFVETGLRHHLRRLDLPRSVRSQRSAAIAHHNSQLERIDGPPVLVASLLEPIQWKAEYFLNASNVADEGASSPDSTQDASATLEEAAS